MRVHQFPRWVVMIVIAPLLVGCYGQSLMQVVATPTVPTPLSGATLPIRVNACFDRTHTAGRNLAADATTLIAKGLAAIPAIEVRDDAPVVLDCEVTKFVEGSAFTRWLGVLRPLSKTEGATVAQVAIMLTDIHDQSTLVIIQGNTTVNTGGFLTVGADEYILNSAVDQAVSKLRAWIASPSALPD